MYLPRVTRRWLAAVLVVMAGVLPTHVAAQGPAPYTINAASWLGSALDNDRVRGARIQRDGTIVVAGNVGPARPGGVVPILLNGASDQSGGVIVRLSADGRTVLSVTRVATQIEDLALDADDNVIIALWAQGLAKLDPSASQVLWTAAGRVGRVDAADDGTVAALVSAANDPEADAPGAGTLMIYAGDGTPLGTFPGRHNTLDVCLDSASATVVTIGWRQAAADGNPVQIAYLRGTRYTGQDQWTDYDWSTDNASPRFINRPENNMADTRGYRCDVGADGKLYAAFEAAGGNHIFRYSPSDISQKVSLAGGDHWHTFSNTRSEHKTFFARYEPISGRFLAGQQFLTRLSDGRGNTARVRNAAITADAAGRVYLGGSSAWGLPLPPHPRYVTQPGGAVFNPLEANPSAYLGGTWFMVMSTDFRTRLYVTRLATDGNVDTLDARILGDGAANVVFGGRTRTVTETFTLDPIQVTPAGGQEGWFAVIAPVQLLPRFTFGPGGSPGAPATLTFDASGSIAAQGIVRYDWEFGDGGVATGRNVGHTYTAPGVYTVRLTLTTSTGDTASVARTVIIGGQSLFLPSLRR
jgi:hypothetical protein